MWAKIYSVNVSKVSGSSWAGLDGIIKRTFVYESLGHYLATKIITLATDNMWVATGSTG